MQDVIYVAALIAFFGIAALFVVACDHIIGSDEAALSESQPATQIAEPEKAAA